MFIGAGHGGPDLTLRDVLCIEGFADPYLYFCRPDAPGTTCPDLVHPVERDRYDRHVEFGSKNRRTFFELMKVAIESAFAFGINVKYLAVFQPDRPCLDSTKQLSLLIYRDHVQHLRDQTHYSTSEEHPRAYVEHISENVKRII